ncbi:MAG: formylglycine-generating enzyme family protein [Planctomycetaceae bacterium]
MRTTRTVVIEDPTDSGRVSISVDPGTHTLNARKYGFFPLTTRYDAALTESRPVRLEFSERTTTPDATGVPDGELQNEFNWPETGPSPAIAPFDGATAQQACADYFKVDSEITNSIGMRLRLIPPGEFLRGILPQEATKHLSSTWVGAAQDRGEQDMHRVVLTNALYAGVTEVTREQFARVIPNHLTSISARQNPERENEPVVNISWLAAVDFCNALSELENLTLAYHWTAAGWELDPEGTGYRLPTEAEWEFLCRAGSLEIWPTPVDKLAENVWYDLSSSGTLHAVGSRKPNGFGLHDTLGNAFEFCHDYYAIGYYQIFVDRVAVNPSGPAHGGSQRRCTRGGSFQWSRDICRPGFRAQFSESGANDSTGFRVVRMGLAD